MTAIEAKPACHVQLDRDGCEFGRVTGREVGRVCEQLQQVNERLDKMDGRLSGIERIITRWSVGVGVVLFLAGLAAAKLLNVFWP